MFKTLKIGMIVAVLFAGTMLEAKMKKSLLVAGAAAAAVHAGEGKDTGENKPLDTLLKTKYTDNELVEVLQDNGYSSVEIRKEGLVVVKIDGRKYMLLNDDDGDLQLYYGIGGVEISYQDINGWNKSKKFTRAYVDSDGDVALEMDLQSDAGLSKTHISEFLDLFVLSVSYFREYIYEHDKSE